ncbi:MULTISPECIES: hypothetical protein [unclassified Burkholderia]|uniref:hypothetical protein n=1 Tax=unclassified Burkholderia TaxID=2613784 RepID=UPI00141D793C|nr:MULTISPECIES: hypothetical protein [unclassified Burkholderia]NIE58003.1 hypothetical protein [Burkholderia sp. Ap-955]NIF09481.1 hypothetical protein [Burkholderia sp. Ax-1735]NIG03020.1 hypothetical protein [Burkholderia sp. Tr-849]
MNKTRVWPSGDGKPVCMLGFDHSEFSVRTGLPFEKGADDLDEYFAGMLLDDRVGPMQFMYYVKAPIKGVVVSVDSQVKTAHAVDVVKKRFGLTDSDFQWIASNE